MQTVPLSDQDTNTTVPSAGTLAAQIGLLTASHEIHPSSFLQFQMANKYLESKRAKVYLTCSAIITQHEQIQCRSTAPASSHPFSFPGLFDSVLDSPFLPTDRSDVYYFIGNFILGDDRV